MILLNVFKMNIVVCLLAGILLSLVFLFLMGKVRGSVYLTNVGETCNKGCQSAVSAIMNTAAAVGFGSVVKIPRVLRSCPSWFWESAAVP